MLRHHRLAAGPSSLLSPLATARLASASVAVKAGARLASTAARRAGVRAAMRDALPGVLVGIVEAYAAFHHAVLVLHPSVRPGVEALAGLRAVEYESSPEEGPSVVHATDCPDRDLRPESTSLCLATDCRSVYAVCGQGGADGGGAFDIKVCDVNGVGEPPPFAWRAVVRPPPSTASPGDLPRDVRLHALDGRLFLFDVGTKVCVWEYEFASDAWTEGADTKALAQPYYINPGAHCAAAGTVLYSFANNGTCFAFDIRARRWRHAFDWCRLFPLYVMSQAPLILPNGGFLFLQTGRVCDGVLQVVRYFGEDTATTADGVGCVGADDRDGADDRVGKAVRPYILSGEDQRPNGLPNVAGSRWRRVEWRVPESSDPFTQFGHCWLEPFGERLYITLYHHVSRGRRGRVTAWHRSLRLDACAAAPLDFFAEPSVAAWTAAWSRVYDDAAAPRFPNVSTPPPGAVLSTLPPPNHDANRQIEAPPLSFGSRRA